ncbi:hypothetical protein ACEK07_30250 [Alcanivoracaceae bacterium MT1]
MKKPELTTENLCNMTMELLIKRLTEESPHLCNEETGNGVLEIIYNFNTTPKIVDSFSVLNNVNKGEMKLTFPRRSFNKILLKENIRSLYFIVHHYLSTRVVPQGRIKIEFQGGGLCNVAITNEGTYADLQRSGRPKFKLDDLLYEEDE